MSPDRQAEPQRADDQMDEKKFPFRKPNGEIIWVNFERMMEADHGELTIEDGTVAVRARDLENNATEKADAVALRVDYTSDTLGFSKKQLPEMQAHLKRSGCKGVEFVQDRDVPGFIRVACDSQQAKLNYAKSRGLCDKNSTNGGSASIGPLQIEQATELVRRKFDDDDSLFITGTSDG